MWDIVKAAKAEKRNDCIHRVKNGLIVMLALVLSYMLIHSLLMGALAGRLYKSDGTVQNTRVYMENVYVEGNVLHYTVVNHTPSDLYHTYRFVQQKKEGAWCINQPDLSNLPQDALGLKGTGRPRKERKLPTSPPFPSFSKIEVAYVLREENLSPGDYRVRYQSAGLDFEIVGYYSIPASK